jgi:outer membrane receptor for ferrienterochelin and colicins
MAHGRYLPEGRMNIKMLQVLTRAILLIAASMLIFGNLSWSEPAADDRDTDLTDLSLEDLGKVEIYSASKFSQKVTEAPASISIVTAADIKRYGYESFDDILRSITGFYVTYDRNYAYVGVRGFGPTGDYNSRVLILIDGHRLNDNIYNSNGIGTDFPLSLDLIERIEVVRGPGSSLYGTNAFFAVINVIPRRGRTFSGGRFSAEAASQQTYQGTATFGQQFDNGLEILLSGSYMDSKGHRRLYFPEFDSPENNSGIAQDADTDRRASAFAGISFHDFNAQLSFKTREKRIPTASFGTTFNDRREQTADTTAYLDIRYERGFRQNWNVLARTSVDAYESDGDYPYSYSEGDSTHFEVNRDKVSGRWWGGEAQLTRKIAGRHHLTVGTEWRYGFRGVQVNYDEPDYYLFMNRDNKTTDFGSYIQGELSARDNLLLSAGVRYDHYSTFGGTTNPRFGLVYSPWEKTTIKVLYGHAFRAPNLFELYYEDANSSKSNPKLQPEKINTLELVLEQRLGQKIRIAGSAYRYEIKNQIRQGLDPSDGLIVFGNTGKNRGQGIEFELEGKDLLGIDGRLSYALQRAVRHPNEATLSNSPHHIAKLYLYRNLIGPRGGAGLEISYMSARKTLGDRQVGGFLLTSFTASYEKLLSNLNLSAGIYNVFNKRHSDPGGSEHVSDALLQDGRSVRVRLDYAFPVK